MTCESHEAFLELYRDMVLAHESRYQAKLSDYGDILDQIRGEIETHGYSRSHQNDLGIILQFLKKVNNSELSEKLQNIIDSLGNPQHN